MEEGKSLTHLLQSGLWLLGEVFPSTEWYNLAVINERVLMHAIKKVYQFGHDNSAGPMH